MYVSESETVRLVEHSTQTLIDQLMEEKQLKQHKT